MQVQDLIKELQRCKPDAIFCTGDGDGEYIEASGIIGFKLDPREHWLDEDDEVPLEEADYITCAY